MGKQFISEELGNPRFKPKDITYIEEEPPQNLDDLGIQTIKQEEESIYKDLKTMVTKEDIDTKTILTPDQIERAHRLDMFRETLEEDNENEDVKESIRLIQYFNKRMFELKVNKNGLSREQFIKIVEGGERKIQEAQQNKIQKMLTM